MSELPLAPDLQPVANRFFPEVRSIEAVPAATGLARVEVSTGNWMVRRWPDGTAMERVAFVHEALRLGREQDLDAVPAVAVAAEGSLPDRPTIVAHETHLYEALSWLPGEPAVRRPVVAWEGGSVDLPGALPGELDLQLAALIARFHSATSGAVESAGAPRSPLRGFSAAANRTWRQQLHQLDPLSPRVPSVRAWRAAARRGVSLAMTRIEEAAEAGQEVTVVVHGNLWPSHVLASHSVPEQRITGIIDWTDAIATSPLIDIAQMITHFSGWTPDHAEAVLSAYHDVRPLKPVERRLLPAVAALDLVVQVGRLLAVGYGDVARLDQGERSLVRNGAAAMTASLETLANVLEYGETRPPRQFKKWVYRKPVVEQGKRRGGKKR